MRVQVTGTVVEVERRSWTDGDGNVVESFDAFLAADNPRYGADRISGPASITPQVGDVVSYVASVSARAGKRGPWLSVWCIESAPVAVAA